jgi:hypothetical protein
MLIDLPIQLGLIDIHYRTTLAACRLPLGSDRGTPGIPEYLARNRASGLGELTLVN